MAERRYHGLETGASAGGPCRAMSVEAGQWHRLEALESRTVIFEAKDGKYGEDGSESLI